MEQALSFSTFEYLPPPPVDGLPIFFPVLNLVSITQRDLTQLKSAANYWKALHRRSCAREAILKKTIEYNNAQYSERETLLKNEIELKEAQIRDLRHRLFAKKSESINKNLKLQPSQSIKRPRGQQRGSRTHGRTQRPELEVIEEHHELENACCTHCGLQYSAFPGAEESEIVEIEVKAYRRKVLRKCYIKSCSCLPSKDSPQFIVAPPVPKVIPKSPYGTSIWIYILLAKYQRLTHWDENIPLTQQSVLFDQAQIQLGDQLQLINERCTQLLLIHQAATTCSDTAAKRSSAKKKADATDSSLLQPGQLHEGQRSVLISLQNHWHGLIVFLTNPAVKMDNNSAERAIRNPVIGRKNYYGSGSIRAAM